MPVPDDLASRAGCHAHTGQRAHPRKLSKRLTSALEKILALKFGGPLTNRQIAGLTGLTESNVGVILHRSLLKLRTLLAPDQMEGHAMTANLDQFALELDTLLGLHPGPTPASDDNALQAASLLVGMDLDMGAAPRPHSAPAGFPRPGH